MDHTATAELLDRADKALALPRLGGMARADGVLIVSERFWAFARRDGTVHEGRMRQPPAVFRVLPLVRGLVRLGASLSPLFRRTGVARGRERFLLAVAVLAPFLFFVLPHGVSLVAAYAVTIGLLCWVLRGRTLFLHGAEHRAIAAAEERRLARTWTGEARPSRFSPRCGTNFGRHTRLARSDDGALAARSGLEPPRGSRSPLARTCTTAPDDTRAEARGNTTRAHRRRGSTSMRARGLGGFGGIPLVVRARCSFRGKDARSVDSS